jgi:hypothetical protein
MARRWSVACAPLTVQRIPVCSIRSVTRCRQAPSARAPTEGWSAADGTTGGQVFVVPHVLAVVGVLPDDRLECPSFLAPQIAVVQHPPQPADHITHLALQELPQAVHHKLLRLRTLFRMETVGRLPQPLQHMEQVQNADGPREPLALPTRHPAESGTRRVPATSPLRRPSGRPARRSSFCSSQRLRAFSPLGSSADVAK